MKSKNEEAVTVLSEKAQEIVNEYSAPIMKAMRKIRDATDLDSGKISLTTEELCMLAVRLPAECSYLQARINQRTIPQRLRDIVTQNEVTENIVMLRETGGDARERQRRAEALHEVQMLSDEAENQILQALQQIIIRADRTYEGIKKIIDARNREWSLDKKPGYPVSN